MLETLQTKQNTDKKSLTNLRLALPKGRIQPAIFQLLEESGVSISVNQRGYRPRVSLSDVETKIFKPQNVVEMLALGSRDVGFAGADWIRELNADVVEVLDTGLSPVKIVAAAPGELLVDGELPDRQLIVATEYPELTKQWVNANNLDATIIRAYGATEVFPPEDADFIVDNTSTGQTLADNGLVIFDQLMTSSTRMYASKLAMESPVKRARIEDLSLILRAVLDGRKRVMIEVNVANDSLFSVIEALPAMQKPTVSPLYGDDGFAVKAAVLRSQLAELIPIIKVNGGRDIVVSNLTQLIA